MLIRVRSTLLALSAVCAFGCQSWKQESQPNHQERFPLPMVRERQLGNGLHISLVERHSVPTVWLQILFDGGDVIDADPPGLASICAELMNEGPRNLDRDGYSRLLNLTGTGITIQSEARHHGIYLGTLSHSLGRAMEVLAEIILRPALRSEDLDRIISDRIAEIERARRDPFSALNRLSPLLALGSGARLTRPAELRQIHVDHCRAFVSRYFRPQGARLVAVGDSTASRFIDVLEDKLYSWTGDSVPTVPAAQNEAVASIVYFVDVPGSGDAVVAGLHPTKSFALSRDALSSFLIRAEVQAFLRGHLESLTYNVKTLRRSFRFSDYHLFWFQTNEGTVASSLQAVMNAFSVARQQPPSAFVKSESKQAVIFDLLDELDSGPGLRNFYGEFTRFGASGAEGNQLPKRILGLSASDVSRGLDEIATSQLRFLVIGDRLQVLPQLKAFLSTAETPTTLAIVDYLGETKEVLVPRRAGSAESPLPHRAWSER